MLLRDASTIIDFVQSFIKIVQICKFVDIVHILGLAAVGVMQSPFKYADIMSTTSITLT